MFDYVSKAVKNTKRGVGVSSEEKRITEEVEEVLASIRRDATGEEVDFTNPSVTGTGEGDVDIDGNEENKNLNLAEDDCESFRVVNLKQAKETVKTQTPGKKGKAKGGGGRCM